jgi:hypothetical protein
LLVVPCGGALVVALLTFSHVAAFFYVTESCRAGKV